MIKRVSMPSKPSSVFPSQKKATTAKSENWAVSCIEGAEGLTLLSNSDVRQSYYNKLKNYDLFNDIIDMRDVEKVCSPLGLDMKTFPATMQNYPLANPKIKLLMGEEMKRKFEWRVRSTNPNTVSSKNEQLRNALVQFMTEMVQSKQDLNEDQLKAKLQDLQKYYKYTYQDIREKMGSDILAYFFMEQKLKEKFSRGFADALISGEEIYRSDIIAGSPVITKCNPLNIFVYGMGESPYIDDADIIIEDSYMPVGSIIDEFYEYLTPGDIDELENKNNRTSGTGQRGTGDTLNYKNQYPTLSTDIFTTEPINVDTSENRNRFGGYHDDAGNIRVTRVVWKSRRKIGKLTYYDESGLQQSMIVDENFKANEQYGETIEWLWINEYWEGTRIGKDLYVKIQPRPIQFRSINNLSQCKSGYVGTVYNVNASRARSLYDQMKPYQYLYNIFMYRTELAFSKYKGPIIEINAAAIPSDWELDKWMYYAEVMGYALMDPFNESSKGSSTGTLAGSMNTVGGKVLSDDSIGNYIQANIQMLQYLERQIGSISGVSEQRQGQIETKELVGNVERAVTQSSHITEPWFATHEHVKLRVLEMLLETAKFCFREEKDKRLQYVLDDMSTMTLKIDGELLNESDYTIFINNSGKDMEFEQALKQLAHAGLQNDKLNFADVIKVFSANNLTDMAKSIEDAEERKSMQMQQAEQMQREHEQKLLQMEMENREDEQAARIEELRVKGEEERATLQLKYTLESGAANADMGIKQAQAQHDMGLKAQELALKEAEMKENLRLKEEELKSKTSMENKKLEATLKAQIDKLKKEIALQQEIQKKKAEAEKKAKEQDSKNKIELAKKDSETKLQIEKEKADVEKKILEQEKKLEQERFNLEKEMAQKEFELEQEKMKKELEMMEDEGEKKLELLERENEIKLQLKREEAKIKAQQAKQQAKKKNSDS